MYKDIDDMYEAYMDGLIEEYEAEEIKKAAKARADGDNTRFLMWDKILGPNFNYWTASGGEKKRLKRAFAKALGTQPHMICEDGLGFYMSDTCQKITMEDFNRARAALKNNNPVQDYIGVKFDLAILDDCPLDCCDAPVPCCSMTTCTGCAVVDDCWSKTKKKDKPMYGTKCAQACAPTASVNINASDEFSPEKVAQEHLLGRLRDAFWSKRNDLQKTYHLYETNEPKTIKEMLDRIKAGDYKFDTDYKDEYVLNLEFEEYDNPFRYFDWRKVPKDQAGFDKATALLEKAYSEAIDTIKVLGSKEGLTAFRAFEAQSFTVN